MPRKNDVTYEVEGSKYDSYPMACAAAVNLSLARDDEEVAISRFVHTIGAARRLFGEEGVELFHRTPRDTPFNYITVRASQSAD
jgi:hypothetical protein